MTRARWSMLAVATLIALPVAADEIELQNGGRINGIVVKRTPQAVVIETSPGLVTIPASRIVRIVQGSSSLELWRQRSAALHPGDARGWASLARWADDAGLTTQARSAWDRVLEADPGNAEAHRALGHVQHQGAWMDSDEAYRARGFVHAEGRWMSPPEHEALLRQQAQDDAALAERAAAEMRLREAEARAREAEALARAAESGTAVPPGDVWWGYGYPYGYGNGYGNGGRRGEHVEHHGSRGPREAGGAAKPSGPGGGRPARPTPIGGGGGAMRTGGPPLPSGGSLAPTPSGSGGTSGAARPSSPGVVPRR